MWFGDWAACMHAGMQAGRVEGNKRHPKTPSCDRRILGGRQAGGQARGRAGEGAGRPGLQSLPRACSPMTRSSAAHSIRVGTDSRVLKPLRAAAGGWVDGWMDGWMHGQYWWPRAGGVPGRQEAGEVRL